MPNPTLTTFSTVGPYTYQWPPFATHVDVVLLPGGGGGEGGSGNFLLPGLGAAAGVFATITLVHGIDVPLSTTTITGVVGDGGAAGAGGVIGTPGVAGQNTTAIADGWAGLIAPGAPGGGGEGG